MTNPANELLHILQSWEGPANKSVSDNRGNGNYRSLDYWHAHLDAVRCLDGIERHLRLIELANSRADIDPWLRSLPPIYSAVFGLDPAWGERTSNSASQRQTPAQVRNELQKLSTLFESAGTTRKLTDNDRAELLELLDRATQQASQADFLNGADKAAITELLRRAQALTQNPNSDSIAVRDAGLTAGGLMVASTGASTTESDKKAGFFRTALRIFGQVGIGAAGDAAGEGLVEGAKVIINLIGS